MVVLSCSLPESRESGPHRAQWRPVTIAKDPCPQGLTASPAAPGCVCFSLDPTPSVACPHLSTWFSPRGDSEDLHRALVVSGWHAACLRHHQRLPRAHHGAPDLHGRRVPHREAVPLPQGRQEATGTRMVLGHVLTGDMSDCFPDQAARRGARAQWWEGGPTTMTTWEE